MPYPSRDWYAGDSIRIDTDGRVWVLDDSDPDREWVRAGSIETLDARDLEHDQARELAEARDLCHDAIDSRALHAELLAGFQGGLGVPCRRAW